MIPGEIVSNIDRRVSGRTRPIVISGRTREEIADNLRPCGFRRTLRADEKDGDAPEADGDEDVAEEAADSDDDWQSEVFHAHVPRLPE